MHLKKINLHLYVKSYFLLSFKLIKYDKNPYSLVINVQPPPPGSDSLETLV